MNEERAEYILMVCRFIANAADVLAWCSIPETRAAMEQHIKDGTLELRRRVGLEDWP